MESEGEHLHMSVYLLHGPPGTGKTRTLSTEWIPRAVERHGPEKVVVCSLTKAAAIEIASRVDGIPRQHIGTLHALAYRLLGKPTIAESLIDEWNDSAHPEYHMSTGSTDVDEMVQGRGASEGDKLMQRAQVLRHRMLPRDGWAHDVLAFQEDWESWCAERDCTDFTALIEEALRSTPSAPGNPGMLIMDEAQDASLLELELLRKWSRRCDLVLAGDADQAIYTWRGARPSDFLSPPGGCPENAQRELVQSYRCSSEITALAKDWIAPVVDRRAVDWQSTPETGEVLHQRDCSFQRSSASVSDEIQGLVSDGSVMVLASCGYMLRNITKELRYRGVAFHNPYKRGRGEWNPMRGGVERARAFLSPIKRGRPWSWGDLAAWTAVCRASGVLKLGAKAEIESAASDEELRSVPVSPGRTRELLEESALEDIGERMRGGATRAVQWLQLHALASKHRVFDYAEAMVENGGMDNLFSEPRVVVGTVHSVKGSESDSVVLSPDISVAAAQMWETGHEDDIRRTMYVGMTRARHKLMLCGPSNWNAVQWD